MSKKKKEFGDFSFKMPSFSSKKWGFESTNESESPLDKIEYEGNVESDSKKELNEFQKEFKKNREGEKAQLKNRLDSEFWCCFCFSSRAQKDDFLKKINLFDISDKYFDGYDVAKRLKIELLEENLDQIAKI